MCNKGWIELKQMARDASQAIDALLAENAKLRAEVEVLRRDAELFRQLRELPDELLGAQGVPCVAVPDGPLSGRYVTGPDLDVAMGSEAGVDSAENQAETRVNTGRDAGAGEERGNG